MKDNIVRFSWYLGWVALAAFSIVSAWYISRDFMKGPEEGLVPIILMVFMFLLLIYCLGLAWLALQQIHLQNRLNNPVREALFWTPRVMSLVFALFLLLFSFDVFEGPESIWLKLGGFLVHSIPSLVMFIACLYAWKHEWLGALIFMGWGIFYVISFPGFMLGVYYQIGFLPFSLGLLYLLNWRYKEDVRLAREA